MSRNKLGQSKLIKWVKLNWIEYKQGLGKIKGKLHKGKLHKERWGKLKNRWRK